MKINNDRGDASDVPAEKTVLVQVRRMLPVLRQISCSQNPVSPPSSLVSKSHVKSSSGCITSSRTVSPPPCSWSPSSSSPSSPSSLGTTSQRNSTEQMNTISSRSTLPSPSSYFSSSRCSTTVQWLRLDTITWRRPSGRRNGTCRSSLLFPRCSVLCRASRHCCSSPWLWTRTAVSLRLSAYRTCPTARSFS